MMRILLAVMAMGWMMSACTSEEVGRASYQSAKKWCGQTNDHCTVNND